MSQQISEVNDKIIQSKNEMNNIIKTLKGKLENSEEDFDDDEEDKKKEKDETELRIQKNLFDAMIKNIKM